MIFITGATGFVGGNLVEELRGRSFKVRCLVRDPDRASWLRDMGCELAKGDVTDPASVRAALTAEVTAAVHLVGILYETASARFEDMHVRGTMNVVEACRAAGVTRYLHISALGTRQGARSRYHKTKWEAEEAVRASGLAYTIFRPSVLFGRGDKFTNLFAGMMRLSPVMVIPGCGENKMQPLYVKDLVGAMAASLERDGARGKTFEVAGPEQLTFDAIIDAIAAATGRRILKLHAPMPLMRLFAAGFEAVLPKPPITRDQLLMLEEDNVTEDNALIDFFGIKPVAFVSGMKGYLK